MSRAASQRLAAGLLAVGLAQAACGQRGNPLPPLRLVPAPVTDLTAHRVDDRVELAWTVPAANSDGSTPAAVTRIEIYAIVAIVLIIAQAVLLEALTSWLMRLLRGGRSE